MRKFSKRYTFVKNLGNATGAFATGFIARKRRNNKRVFVKHIRVNPEIRDLVMEEKRLLQTLEHDNIPKIHDIYRDDSNMNFVMELCDGGDLYAKIPYVERDACAITTQLLSAVKYLHKRKVKAFVVSSFCVVFFFRFFVSVLL